MPIIDRLLRRLTRTDTDVWIDEFARVYADSRGPCPFDYPRRKGESISAYRARFEAWLCAPSKGWLAVEQHRNESARA